LKQRLKGQVVLVGIGNPMRGDDVAGSWLAGRLKGKVPARVVDAGEVPESYLGEITRPRPDTVVLLDAVDFGASPGSAAILEQGDLAEGGLATTHRTPLHLLVEFVKRETGAGVFVLGVQPQHTAFGAAVSERVAEGLAALEDLLTTALDDRGEAART
jgi:hydrogenase 3 maturation protease